MSDFFEAVTVAFLFFFFLLLRLPLSSSQEVAFAAVGSGLKNMTAMRRGTFWNRL